TPSAAPIDAAVVAAAPVDAAIPNDVPACDVDALRQKGSELVSRGDFASGLEQLDKAIACKSSPALVRLAYTAAGGAGHAGRARELFSQIPTQQQGSLAPICLRNKIDPGGNKPDVRRPEPPDLNKLWQQNRYAEIVTACTATAYTGDRATICVLSACHTHDA